jgi:hypothetical protein
MGCSGSKPAEAAEAAKPTAAAPVPAEECAEKLDCGRVESQAKVITTEETTAPSSPPAKEAPAKEEAAPEAAVVDATVETAEPPSSPAKEAPAKEEVAPKAAVEEAKPAAAAAAKPPSMEPISTQPTIQRNYAPNVYPSPPVPKASTMASATTTEEVVLQEKKGDAPAAPGLAWRMGSWLGSKVLRGASTALVLVTGSSVASPEAEAISLPAHICENAKAAFEKMDKNGDGMCSRIEVIQACKSDPSIRSLLGMPEKVRQEDGTRDAFEVIFQAMDVDGSKAIDEAEFVAYFGRAQKAAESGKTVGELELQATGALEAQKQELLTGPAAP